MPIGSIQHPDFGFVITAPEPLLSSARFNRVHRRASKSAIEAVMLLHWKNVMPGHFKQNAKSKYQHKRRTDRYQNVRRFKFHSTTDLVKTGGTKLRMLGIKPKVTISGNADTSMLAVMRLPFNFKLSRDVKDPRRVTMKQMATELETWTSEEEQNAVRQYRDIYVDTINADMKLGPRLRREFMARSGSL